jgi:regulator of cell morphogenesis and NO signaling
LKTTESPSVGSFVANDYRTATVFQKYGIDFCCKGGKSIEEVCENKKINTEELLTELSDVSNMESNQVVDFKSWPLDLLADYIEKQHHSYVEKSIPPLNQFLDKLCKVHGSNHPELFEIRDEFLASSQELTAHMKKEEMVLFPYVRNMVHSKVNNDQYSRPAFGTVENPIRMMMQEHEVEGERFRKIAELSDNYNPPSDACTTYRVAFSLLKEFESDLHLHIHLENNILFPKSIEMENEMTA